MALVLAGCTVYEGLDSASLATFATLFHREDVECKLLSALGVFRHFIPFLNCSGPTMLKEGRLIPEKPFVFIMGHGHLDVELG